MIRRFFCVGTTFVLVLFLSTVSRAEGERLPLEKAQMESPVMKDITIEKKITGRLPNGYANVVTNAQRDDIYKIQKEYAEVIERLKLRIQMLESERNKKIDALLTEEQVEKVKRSQKERSATRRSNAAEKSPGETASE